MKTIRLSKSKYLSGLQCPKRLWLEIHKPELVPPPPPGQQRLFDQGTQVGVLARKDFPEGCLIKADYLNIPKAIKETKAALDKYQDILFEGCFIRDNVLVRPDIILRNDQGDWNIIEVKSSTSVKTENIHDVAIQVWVLQGCGLNVNRMFLKHINQDCTYPDLSNLFKIEDITEQVKTVLPRVPQTLSEYWSLIERLEPETLIGQHCNNPYECPFVPYCWQEVPEHSIFNIPGLRWSVKERLIEENRLDIKKLPEGFPLNKTQRNYVQSFEDEKPVVDWNGIQEELRQLDYPLYSLDFETDGPAIPRFNGMHPYEQFPFQYSCHILSHEGTLEHRDYLHETDSDPRRPLLMLLLQDLGTCGTIVAYNANFEKGILNKLAQWFPEYAKQLESIIARLWDQLIIFRKYYTDYRFQGSNSLKNVLPVIVPSMTYEHLNVKDGIEAQVAWNEMIQLPAGSEKSKLIQELKEYCGQDTMAMVEIHRLLVSGKSE